VPSFPCARWPAIAVALCLASSTARATAQSDRAGALRASTRTPVAVASEHVDLDCRAGEEENELLCALTVTWELRNDSQEAGTASIVLSWPFDAAPTVTANGAPLAEVPTLHPAAVLVPPGASAPVVLRATLRLRTTYVGTGAGVPIPVEPHDPLHARHPLLSTAWNVARRGLVWVRPDDLRFASVGPTRVTVSVPEGWHGIGHLRKTRDRARRYTYETPSRDPPNRIGIELARGSRGDILRHGGPFLALGATIDRGFRGRIAYEMGIGEWVLVSVALDSDLRSQVIVTPEVEVASWGVVIVPSLSLGVGLPIQVAPAVEVGLRLETSATFHALGFVASFDYWPGQGLWEVSLLGRIGM
jgi:hypothetical protein